MLSMDNVYSVEELEEFEQRIRKLPPRPKNRIRGRAQDRRAGHLDPLPGRKICPGRDPRATASRATRSRPTSRRSRAFLSSFPEREEVEVRGEIFLPFESFQKINRDREAREEPLFANPRNAASGSIRLLDPREVAARKLDVFLYSLFVDGEELASQWENLRAIKELGFKINPHSRLCRTLGEVIDYWEEWTEKRDTLDYDADGVVIKVNSTEQRRELGVTAKFPRWAISFKFPARQATTRLVDIIIQVGRTGALTPVAVLEPVKLSGITISRATLHNEDEIKRKDIRIGDYVLIERSGDVIPKIVGPMKERRTGQEKEFVMARSVPGLPFGRVPARRARPSRAAPIPPVPAKLRESILHFAARRAMNIEGLGEALVDQLLAKKLVRIRSRYLCPQRRRPCPSLERMGPKSSQNLIDEIEKSKANDIARLIFALGIRHVGEASGPDPGRSFPGHRQAGQSRRSKN